MKKIKAEVVSNQLSTATLKKHFNYITRSLSERPEASFKFLADWVLENFSEDLTTSEDLKHFVNNRINIDENFILYITEKNINLECLYLDPIICWNDLVSTGEGDNFERFVAPGVYKIFTDDFEFIQSSLFHKGTNNEDELSFFITCSDENFDKFVLVRNDFDVWSQKRDRENQKITVIGGDAIPYSKDETWENLFLPEDIKSDIKNTVEVFLNSKDWYLENNLPWKKGLFLYGVQGNGKTSIIRTIISQYDFKPVTICAGGSTAEVEEAFEYAQSQSPSLLYFEDLDTLLSSGQVEKSSFLNFMDGVASKNGLFVIATANNPELLSANIIDRPSRFDRKFEIPVPNKELTVKYLKRWFKDKITVSQLNELAKRCVKEKFTYAYLKEVYISANYIALSKNRKKLNISDIDTALKRIVSERLRITDGGINVNSYLNLKDDEVS